MSIVNLPNVISFSRIVVAPFFYYFIKSDKPELVSIACWIFIIASITDVIDGWAARRLGIVTRLGEFLDPLADKILTLLALISFAEMNIIPLWMVLIILIRDIFSTSFRVIALAKGTPIETSRSAKVKTTIEMVFISIILSLIYLKINIESVNSEIIDKWIYSPITYFIALIVTLMAIYSLLGYAWKYKKLLKMSKKVEKI
jgi:CDP-diacylglycerol--glycerol-3-phosphate 3-phosphatidyltransferase